MKRLIFALAIIAIMLLGSLPTVAVEEDGLTPVELALQICCWFCEDVCAEINEGCLSCGFHGKYNPNGPLICDNHCTGGQPTIGDEWDRFLELRGSASI